MDINGKMFVVTGGGNGIGREVVLQLLKKGARVAAVDIKPDALIETARLAGDPKDGLTTHVLNITDKAAVEGLPPAVITAHGVVDGLVNVAGIIQKFVQFKDLDFTEIERVMNINFWGTLYMVKAFLPLLLKRPEANITNVSSMGGFLPVPGQTLYGASKAAVKLFTEGLNSELHDTNVHVTVVFPGAIGTNIAANSGVTNLGASAESPKIKMTAVDVAGEAIVEGIEKNAYRVLIGSDAKMMDFLYRLMPKRAARIIFEQMKSILPK
jgi:short-subunit dehydrogenase